MDPTVSADLDKLAVEAEADRLSGIYVKVVMLAKARQVDFDAAGREAVAAGLVAALDWDLLREAVGRD